MKTQIQRKHVDDLNYLTTKTFKKNSTARLEQKPGSEVYAFSHPEGSKDDRFWAVTLAVYATEREPKHELIVAISF